jgi:hypothetical protein
MSALPKNSDPNFDPNYRPRGGLKTSYNGFGPKIRDESYDWMKREIAEGRVKPPSRCSACGETRGHIDYHTEDYSRPFGPHIYAYELCFRCHMMVHARFRMRHRWKCYIVRLEQGAIYQPLMHRGQIGQIWEPGWLDHPIRWGPPREWLVFFRSLSLERVSADNQGRLFEE